PRRRPWLVGEAEGGSAGGAPMSTITVGRGDIGWIGISSVSSGPSNVSAARGTWSPPPISPAATLPSALVIALFDGFPSLLVLSVRACFPPTDRSFSLAPPGLLSLPPLLEPLSPAPECFMDTFCLPRIPSLGTKLFFLASQRKLPSLATTCTS